MVKITKSEMIVDFPLSRKITKEERIEIEKFMEKFWTGLGYEVERKPDNYEFKMSEEDG